MPSNRFRPYHVVPGDPIAIEVRAANGETFVIHAVVDSVPYIAGDRAQRIVVRDAVAEPAPPPEG